MRSVSELELALDHASSTQGDNKESRLLSMLGEILIEILKELRQNDKMEKGTE